MEPGANVLDGFRHRTATDFAFLDLTGTAVNDFLPLRFGVGVHGVVEAGDELAGQIRPVLLRQGQHFSDFFSGHAHAGIISLRPAD
jgi:hypothetical protein